MTIQQIILIVATVVVALVAIIVAAAVWVKSLKKVAEAKAQAEELIQAARTEAAREAESISRKSEAEVANYKERAASSMDLQKRSRILEAKQAVIAEVLDKAYEKVSTMEKDEYFSMLLKLVGKYALAQEEIYNQMPGIPLYFQHDENRQGRFGKEYGNIHVRKS